MVKMDLIGFIGNDATVNNVNGRTVVNINIAHTEKYKDAQGNNKEKTLWVSAAWWTDKTGIVPYLKKGTQVYVTGIPDVKTYPNQQGQTIAQLTLRVQSIQLLGSTQNRNESTAPVSQQQESYNVPSDDSDNLPF